MPVSACLFEPWAGKVFQFSEIECSLCSVALRWFREWIGIVCLSHNCPDPQTILITHKLFSLHPLGNRETSLFSNRWNTEKPRRVYCLLVHSDLYKCWPKLCSNRDQEPSFLTWKCVSWRFINRGKHLATGEHIVRSPCQCFSLQPFLGELLAVLVSQFLGVWLSSSA